MISILICKPDCHVTLSSNNLRLRTKLRMRRAVNSRVEELTDSIVRIVSTVHDKVCVGLGAQLLAPGLWDL